MVLASSLQLSENRRTVENKTEKSGFQSFPNFIMSIQSIGTNQHVTCVFTFMIKNGKIGSKIGEF